MAAKSPNRGLLGPPLPNSNHLRNQHPHKETHILSSPPYPPFLHFCGNTLLTLNTLEHTSIMAPRIIVVGGGCKRKSLSPIPTTKADQHEQCPASVLPIPSTLLGVMFCFLTKTVRPDLPQRQGPNTDCLHRLLRREFDKSNVWYQRRSDKNTSR